MKKTRASVIKSGCFVFVCWLLAFVSDAQSRLPDSVAVFGGSTVLRVRPLTLMFGTLNLAIEQTIGKRSSIQLDGQMFAAKPIFLWLLGQTQGLSAAFFQYPLASQTAPQGFYVGPKLSYRRMSNPGWGRLITISDAKGDLSLWSAEAVVGYQYCSRQNIALNAQGSIGWLHHLTYQQTNRAGQATTVDQTKFIPTTSVTLSVGYRFRHRHAP